MKKINIASVLLLIFLNISYAFSQTKNSNIESTIEYFHQRNEAASLVKNEKWQEAIPILENLTGLYQSDSDLPQDEVEAPDSSETLETAAPPEDQS